MNVFEQLDKWVEGDAIHNDESNECCPDFSCCNPQFLASKEERIAFRDAYMNQDMKIVEFMLMNFLSKAISTTVLKGRIVGIISGLDYIKGDTKQ